MAKRSAKSEANETPARPTAKPAAKPAAARTRTPAAVKGPRRLVAMAAEPSEDDIRYRAYLRYVERGRDDGGAFDDWLHAERELKKGS